MANDGTTTSMTIFQHFSLVSAKTYDHPYDTSKNIMATPMAILYMAILQPPTHGHPMTIRHLVRKKLWPAYNQHHTTILLP